MKKGQEMPDEARLKMMASKRAKNLSQYKWELAEPYLDNSLNNGSCSNRNRKYINLRQFKEYICNHGFTVAEVGKLCTKQQAAFYSAFCKGKININKEKLEEEYLSGKSLDDIADQYGISKDYIGLLRMLYGIDRKGPKFIQRKKTEKAITQRQKEIIYGSLMGDAKRVSPSSVGFGHCLAQEDYIKWKYDEMKGLRSDPSYKKTKSYDNRSGEYHEAIRFYTKANSDVEEIVSKFYTKDKQITPSILENITELGLAVWFMDDGNTDWRYKRRKKFPHRENNPEIKICTDSFNLDSIMTIEYWFKYKWGINCHRRQRGNGWRIIIDSDSRNNFFNLIKPHIIPSMMYKVDYEKYLEHKGF